MYKTYIGRDLRRAQFGHAATNLGRIAIYNTYIGRDLGRAQYKHLDTPVLF